MSGNERINVYLPSDLKDALEKFALERQLSRSSAIAQIISDRLQGNHVNPDQETLQSLVESAVDKYLAQKFAPIQ